MWCSSPCGAFILSRKRAGPAFPWGFFEHFFVDAPSTVASRSASTIKKDAPSRKAIATWTRGLFETRRGQSIERGLRPL